jgi:hypothetical protein
MAEHLWLPYLVSVSHRKLFRRRLSQRKLIPKEVWQ